jgi:hypothetical protein
MKPVIYLVGAIRDGRKDDIIWRETVINQLKDRATILNPMGGKTYNPTTKAWTMGGGVTPGASIIVKHDFWCVDHANVIVANMTSLAEGYPSIGSLMELGRATARGALIYTILDPNYTGHQNQALYRLHPFLSETSAASFASVAECVEFLRAQLNVLSGSNPHFGGYK